MVGISVFRQVQFPDRFEGPFSRDSNASNPDWKAGEPSKAKTRATSIPHSVYSEQRPDQTTENQEYTSRAGSISVLSPVTNPDRSEFQIAGSTPSADSSPLTSISEDFDVESPVRGKMVNSFHRCHEVASSTRSVNRQVIRQTEPCTARSMRGRSIPTCTACAQKDRESDYCRFRGTYLRRSSLEFILRSGEG